ncbi:uncharacterized protein TNCV_671931 [Trichonephila clavipes]|nr:uncharacterized protein TNCV_671931 [Trichonephila clavipes]
MDVCKYIVPSRHEGTLNSSRDASPIVRLVEGKERWEAPDHPQGVLPLNWGETELNRSVICMVLKATANDRCHLALCHDEYRGPCSGLSLSVIQKKYCVKKIAVNHNAVAKELTCAAPLHGGTVLELVTGQAAIRYLAHSATTATAFMGNVENVSTLNNAAKAGRGGLGLWSRTRSRRVINSRLVPLKTHRVGDRCALNLSRAQTSSRWCGVVVRRGGCQIRCRPRHFTMVQNYEIRRQKPSCS